MSSNGFDLLDKSGQVRESQDRMYDSLEDLASSIERGRSLAENLGQQNSQLEDEFYNFLNEVEQDYQTIIDFAEEYAQMQQEMNQQLENMKEFGGYNPGAYSGPMMSGMQQQQTNQGLGALQQQQSMANGRMTQNQGIWTQSFASNNFFNGYQQNNDWLNWQNNWDEASSYQQNERSNNLGGYMQMTQSINGNTWHDEFFF